MPELTRTGVAIDSDLLARFDQFIAKQGYINRSEAFRDLIRDKLVGAAVEPPRLWSSGPSHLFTTTILAYCQTS